MLLANNGVSPVLKLDHVAAAGVAHSMLTVARALHSGIGDLVTTVCSLINGFAQRSFQCGVKIAANFRYSLIAKLAKEGRWLVIFKNTFASLVFEQNHPERRIKSSCELIASHL